MANMRPEAICTDDKRSSSRKHAPHVLRTRSARHMNTPYAPGTRNTWTLENGYMPCVPRTHNAPQEHTLRAPITRAPKHKFLDKFKNNY